MGVSPVYMEFGQRLQQVRQEARLTQAELARSADLSRTSITNIEKGRQPVTLDSLFRFAVALGVEPEELLPTEILLKRRSLLPEPYLNDLSEKEARWVEMIVGDALRDESGAA